MNDVARDLGPFVVRQHPVAGGGADGTVPDLFGDAAVAERFPGLLEQAGEVAEVAVAVVAERGFEFGGMAPADDEVRVGVLLVTTRADEVVDQAGDAAAAGRPCRSLADPLSQFLGGLIEELRAADALGRVSTAGPVTGRPRCS